MKSVLLTFLFIISLNSKADELSKSEKKQICDLGFNALYYSRQNTRLIEVSFGQLENVKSIKDYQMNQKLIENKITEKQYESFLSKESKLAELMHLKVKMRVNPKICDLKDVLSLSDLNAYHQEHLKKKEICYKHTNPFNYLSEYYDISRKHLKNRDELKREINMNLFDNDKSLSCKIHNVIQDFSLGKKSLETKKQCQKMVEALNIISKEKSKCTIKSPKT